MTSSRDNILNKLREAQKPFPDAPPRPQDYLPVALLDDVSPDSLLGQFSRIMEELKGSVFVVKGDAAARDKVIELLKSHDTKNLLAWDFKHIPVKKLEAAIKEAGITIHYPEMHDEFRSETLETIHAAQAGLTGADAAIAATGTLVVSTGAGKGRIPTVLAPVHIVVITLDQIMPRLEDWVAYQRAHGLDGLWNSANTCFISGPSKTADIEMELIYGVHGPGIIQVIVKK